MEVVVNELSRSRVEQDEKGKILDNRRKAEPPQPLVIRPISSRHRGIQRGCSLRYKKHEDGLQILDRWKELPFADVTLFKGWKGSAT